MNKVLMSLLFGAFILTAPGYAQTLPPSAAPAAPAAATHPHHERGERHPELHKAIRKLKGAKMDLEKAAHDYGGHKVKAIEAIDRALEELRDALQSDKT
jgi:hypothetical protein